MLFFVVFFKYLFFKYEKWELYQFYIHNNKGGLLINVLFNLLIEWPFKVYVVNIFPDVQIVLRFLGPHSHTQKSW